MSMIDTLCVKRLNHPNGTDINLIRSNQIKTNLCEVGNSHHAAYIYEGTMRCFKGPYVWNEHV